MVEGDRVKQIVNIEGMEGAGELSAAMCIQGMALQPEWGQAPSPGPEKLRQGRQLLRRRRRMWRRSWRQAGSGSRRAMGRCGARRASGT